MTTFRSNGKLLLTAEYVVLDGAMALALPTKLGQDLTIEPNEKNTLIWRSIHENGNTWFESEFSLDEIAKMQTPSNPISKRLLEILISAKQLNPNFLIANNGFSVTTKLDFPHNWGLGSSSTLINNIANWANINPYDLLELTFGGSGYDIACARFNNPIIYSKNPIDNSRIINEVNFNPSFKDELFFIHLNQKQDSREGIKRYNQVKNNLSSTILEINTITKHIIDCDSLSEFKKHITKHEDIISSLINLPTVKTSLFNNYQGAIKSLGAWGGDFILATGSQNDMDYFKQKGYSTIISYSDMIL
ncbi:MAG: GHMP kinase [Bacteroidetes bacterium]|nr:MAG: GHMP kinase [Bacteroidota bacterium]